MWKVKEKRKVCCILHVFDITDDASIGKIKKRSSCITLIENQSQGVFFNFLYCRIVTNWREYRRIHGINFHVTEIWRNKEIIKKKGGKGADARNTFSSLRTKKKDDRRRDGDYTSGEGSTVLLSNSFSFLSAIDVNYTLHSLVLRCTPAIIALRFCSAIRKTITRNRVREGDRKGTV